MGLQLWSRASDSPWVDSVWTSRSDDIATMTSVATETCGLVFWRQDGVVAAAVTGPESRTGAAPVPAGADFVGIQLAVGTSLRMLPTPALLDSGVRLPDTAARSFRLDGARYETPGADDAEALVARLVRDGVLGRDPVVASVLDGRGGPATTRTVERRFRAATGLTRGAVEQIRRARVAAELLAAGRPAASVVEMCGYYDEPHLARALRRYVGRTAGQLRAGAGGAIALQTSADDVVDRLDDAVAVGGRLAQ
ncbi:helix-turn-helix domain-containing protein [Desertihabitans aurantiacus]|uniref:helix-turn-helix domain-containing protein n=1 Tax=Desertihabitans aurantiacus TaxID=2282477 RepID=UPI000DF869D5|nr:AraC family transcriptional regulator [Desertihabitans aurantiacus]